MAQETASAPAAAGSGWDPLVRLTHWGVAAAVLANGLITEEGGQIHVWVGYAALALLVLRLAWGFIGPEEARFASFPPSVSGALAHIREMREGRHRIHRSHNPLGALMAYALWATLAVVTLAGIAMTGSPFVERSGEGVASVAASGYDDGHRDEDGEDEEALEEIHETAANLLLLLAALHVGGVAFESMRSGRNLGREMVTGRRGGTSG